MSSKAGSLILGIETSCDECSASVVRSEKSSGKIEVLGLSTFSQVKIHEPFGGVVPEIASRNHLETVNEMMDESIRQAGISLDELDCIAVTNRPGLVGALLVGVSAAKALAYVLEKPLVAVHHLEGHAASLFLDSNTPITYPLLMAIVSGGHTNLYCMKTPPGEWPLGVLDQSLIACTRDDAAGEAFDKTAKLLGFPYPGGQWIDQVAKGGNPKAYDFPRALKQKSLMEFSFSGLKTAVSLRVEAIRKEGENALEKAKPDLCASLQEAILDALLSKVFLAVQNYGCKTVAVVGGVAANSRLREIMTSELKNVPVVFPSLKYCTDNAAMIAAAGAFRFHQGHFMDATHFLTLNAIANPKMGLQ